MNQLTQLTHDEIDNIINLAKAHAKTVYDRNNNKAKENHGVLFVLEKCYDTFIHAKGGLALFPEILISELYLVRKTIESYSNDNKIPKPDPDIQYAAGVYYSGRAGNIEVLVDTGDIKTKYIITCIE